MKAERIGTVEVTRPKAYWLDGQAPRTASSLEIIVQPGVYGLWRFGGTTFWMPEGQLNMRNIRLGDGMFVLHADDTMLLEGPTIRVPTRMMGEEEYAEFLRGASQWDLIVREDQ